MPDIFEHLIWFGLYEQASVAFMVVRDRKRNIEDV